MSNQLAPLSRPFPKDVDAILAKYPTQDGYILSLFRTFANSTRFLSKAVPNLLDKDSPLDLRTREITILRTTANRGCEYEWGVHVSIFAEAAKLDAEQVAATVLDRSDCWTENEAQLILAIDQLCATGKLDKPVLEAFQSGWSKEQQLEILALVGTYNTISFVANVAQLPTEPFAARFPHSSRHSASAAEN